VFHLQNKCNLILFKVLVGEVVTFCFSSWTRTASVPREPVWSA